MNSNYDNKNMELTYGIVKQLLVKLFQGKGYKRVKEMRLGVEKYHLDHGGKQGVKIEYATTEMLSQLMEEGIAEKHPTSRGYWKILPIIERNKEESTFQQEHEDDEVNILKELKARDDRIERLEKVLLLLLSSEIGNYVGQTAQGYLSIFQSFPLERVEMLIREYGTAEKVIEKFPVILKEKHRA